MWLLILLSILGLAVLGLLLLVLHDAWQRSIYEAKGFCYLGNGFYRLVKNIFTKVSIFEDIAIQYRTLKSSGKQLGMTLDFGIKSFFVADPELTKSILVKDFDHFVDRRKFPAAKTDYLFEKMLFTMTGDKWRQLRAKMSPTFTTGKIKRMFSLFDQSGSKFIKFLNSEIERTGNEEIELTEGYSKFTMDIIASAACGIDSQAFNQKEPSLFEKMGQKMQLEFGAFQIFKFIAMTVFPTKIVNFLELSFFPKEISDFFSGAIKGVIKQRESTGEKRDDFVQLMLEARAGTLKTEETELDTFEKDAMLKDATDKKANISSDLLDDDTIVANCVLFMLAGFDTTQSLLLFCAYALALNPEIQDKLRSEVDSILEENGGKFTYDGMNKMTYLDMIINETLRFYPPVAATERACTMEYKIPGKNHVMKKGEAFIFPVIGIQMDPDFYPEPEKFNPERFSPENKNKINPYTFLPFGQGPRNCIGMRFALTEAKVVISYLVHHFKIEPSAKTLIPMKFANSSSLKPQGGKMYLRLNKIQHS